jgi:malonate transporter
MQNLIFSLQVVAPVFIIVFLGVLLKRWQLINDLFITTSIKLAFNIAMPALVFIKIAETDFFQVFQPGQITFVLTATLISFLFAWLVSGYLTDNGRSKGAFIQGSYRGNYAIIGFAVILNMLGENGLAKAAIILSFVMPLYNVLAVIALTVPTRNEKNTHQGKIIKEILTNPLIIAAVLAFPFSFFNIPLHPILANTGNYLAALALPLALISIGGLLSFRSIQKRMREAFAAVFLKIVLFPLLFTALAYQVGFRGDDLGIMYVLFASPTAIASFIMAKAMDSDAELAANILLISTLGSVFTISIGVFILKSAGFI